MRWIWPTGRGSSEVLQQQVFSQYWPKSAGNKTPVDQLEQGVQGLESIRSLCRAGQGRARAFFGPGPESDPLGVPPQTPLKSTSGVNGRGFGVHLYCLTAERSFAGRRHYILVLLGGFTQRPQVVPFWDYLIEF